MIFNKKSDIQHYLQKIAKEQCHSFRVENEGSLIINGSNKTRKYLAYVNGQWYGGKGEICAIPENMRVKIGEKLTEFPHKGPHLFIISEKRFWMIREDGSVEFASPTKPLSEDVIAVMFAEHAPGLCLYVIDGGTHKSAIATKLEPCEYSLDLAAMIVIAMVRQYDAESADQMENFWFGKGEQDDIWDIDNQSQILN